MSLYFLWKKTLPKTNDREVNDPTDVFVFRLTFSANNIEKNLLKSQLFQTVPLFYAKMPKKKLMKKKVISFS